VVVAFDDGDVEVVSPCNVEVLKFGMRSRVSLSDVYIERATTNKRPRKLSRKMRESLTSEAAEYMWESDGSAAGESSTLSESDSDSSAGEEDDEGDAAESWGRNMARVSLAEDHNKEGESTTVPHGSREWSIDSTTYRRRAAAHVLAHLENVLRLETPASALAFVLNPLATLLEFLDLPERERVQAIARKALLEEVIESQTSLDPHAFETEQSPAPAVRSSSSVLELQYSTGLAAFLGTRAPATSTSRSRQRENTLESTQIAVDRFWEDYFRLVPVLCVTDDPMDFWRTFNATRTHDRTVMDIVRRYMGIPPSAASCERLFSIMTLRKRGKPMLGPQTLRSAVFLKANRWLAKSSDSRGVSE
jgi:hypothetical protein